MGRDSTEVKGGNVAYCRDQQGLYANTAWSVVRGRRLLSMWLGQGGVGSYRLCATRCAMVYEHSKPAVDSEQARRSLVKDGC